MGITGTVATLTLSL